MTMREILLSCTHILWNHPISFFGALRHPRTFENIHTYVMFIGYRRSGKTLTASLLDAHPHILIADELGVLRNIYARFNEKQIYYLLLKNSERFTRKGRTTKGHSHRIHSQFQGTFKDKLLVIGDNHGQGAAMRLKIRPYLLDRLRKTIRARIRVFHVVRNPFDNISSISKRMNTQLKDAAVYYFDLCETVNDTLKRFSKEELFEFRYESLIADPESMLKKMGMFLGVDMSDKYLKACREIVFSTPNQTRFEVKWDPFMIEMVKEKISQYSFLEGYSYDDGKHS